MYRAFPLALILLAAGCDSRDASTPAAANVADQASAAAPAEVPSLEGSWAVSRVGGVADAAGLGMTASISKDSVTLSTGCIKRAWAYSQKRNVVAFTSSPGGSSNCGGAAPSAGAEAAYAALSEANIAIFSKDGKEASLSGTGGTLTLERR